MKIISYNVNGIRSAINKGFIDWLKSANPDVVCLQEIKALKEQLDLTVFEDAGYKYHYWFSAQKRGYSGVAILSKIKPNHVEYGTGIASMDFEGRNIRADFDDFSVMSLYLPSGTNDARLGHKLEYMDMFHDYINTLKQVIPNLIICGDYNICHQAIDIHNPKTNKNSSGFLPEERSWMGEFLNNGFVDTFRHFNPEPHNYTWWSYRARAREKNLGWRIDYQMATQSMLARLKRAAILCEAHHSDHCPVLLEID